MKLFIVPEMTKCHFFRLSLDRVVFVSETGRVGYTNFQTKIAEITLKLSQGRWRWHNSVGQMDGQNDGPFACR